VRALYFRSLKWLAAGCGCVALLLLVWFAAVGLLNLWFVRSLLGL
jgi:hypothetical protein